MISLSFEIQTFIDSKGVLIVHTDVVHAYKNLIQEKEALEASITALTATKVHAEPKDDREVLDNEKNKPVKSEGTESTDQEQAVVEDGVVDHPLVTRDDEVPSDNRPQPHKVITHTGEELQGRFSLGE